MEVTESNVCAPHLGSEIMYSADILDTLEKNPDLRINGGNYVFIEFPNEISIYDMRSAVVKILRGGFIPVIAHIEEYREIIKKPNFAWDLREYGAIIHVNASSVAKMRFGKVSHLLRLLFNKSYVDAVTVSHLSNESENMLLTKATAKITRLFGEDVAEKVIYSTPKLIINNEKIIRY